MTIRYLLIFCTIFFAISCSKNENPSSEEDPLDYREQYVGTYDCTKSNRSFDDDPFALDIEVMVSIIDSTEDFILVNDFQVELLTDGTFGEGQLEGSITDDTIMFYTRPIVNGISLPCFIKGTKI